MLSFSHLWQAKQELCEHNLVNTVNVLREHWRFQTNPQATMELSVDHFSSAYGYA